VQKKKTHNSEIFKVHAAIMVKVLQSLEKAEVQSWLVIMERQGEEARLERQSPGGHETRHGKVTERSLPALRGGEKNPVLKSFSRSVRGDERGRGKTSLKNPFVVDERTHRGLPCELAETRAKRGGKAHTKITSNVKG